MPTRPWYATRSIVQASPDQTWSQRDAARIDRAIAAASRSAEITCRMHSWYPRTATIYYDWPDPAVQAGPASTLHLGPHHLYAATSITSGGVALDTSDYTLTGGPDSPEPPYSRIVLTDTATVTWQPHPTTGPTCAIAVTGSWGWHDWHPVAQVGTGGIDDTTTTLDIATVIDPTMVDVGALLAIDSERLAVTGATSTHQATTLTAPLTASATSSTLTVASTTGLTPGQVITVGAERMLVRDVMSTVAMDVTRAYAGTALAVHSASDPVLLPWTLRVERAATGSTAASHAEDAVVYAWYPPEDLTAYTAAAAIEDLAGMSSAYARPASGGWQGGGEVRAPSPTGPAVLAARLRAHYRRSIQ